MVPSDEPHLPSDEARQMRPVSQNPSDETRIPTSIMPESKTSLKTDDPRLNRVLGVDCPMCGNGEAGPTIDIPVRATR